MQFSTIFSRAWQQKYLTPAERSVYKFVVTVVLFIPNSAILGGVAVVLTWLHTSLPGWLWLIVAAVIQLGLTTAAKYVTAQGDVAVGALIQQAQIATATTMVDAKPIVLPKASAGPPEAPPPIPFH